MKPLTERAVGPYVFERWENSCRILVDDTDLEMTAAVEDTDAYRKTAHELGYGDDLWKMCAEHEGAHVFLVFVFGSPVIDEVTGLDGTPLEDRLFEEAFVCGFQKACNAHPQSKQARAFREFVWGAA